MALLIVSALVFIISLLVGKTVHRVPLKELRRQALVNKNSKITAVYKMASYGESLKILLGITSSLSFSALLIIAAGWAWWLAVLLVLAVVWFWFSVPAHDIKGWIFGFTTLVAPAISWILSHLQPLLGRLAGLLKSLRPAHFHTGLYEKEDLLDLINNQNHQLDNRIPEIDLKIAFGALTFGDKIVGNIMTPRRKLKLVAANDSIGPHLMDELHASGFSRFPVVKDSTKVASPQIIGTLYLKDLMGHDGAGKVRDAMKGDVYFINESNTLREALNAFLKTHHQLLVVVNNFEEIVGVLSLEDVAEQILGAKIIDEFDRYDDLRAVAGLEAKKDKAQHKEVEPETAADSKGAPS